MTEISNEEKKTNPLKQEPMSPLAKKFYSILKNGTPLYQVKGMSKQYLENLYSIAYNLYSAEKYEEAGRIFQTIVFYNHLDKKSWLGAGGSAEMLKQYDKALIAYSYISLLDKSDPLPALHAFDCHFALKNYPQALSALEAVLLLSSKKPEYQEIRKRAEFLRNMLHSTIQESKTKS
ncbi:MAG: SycD/LcrH family type III secretion system chaperone [Chthoniobacterales bacterium]